MEIEENPPTSLPDKQLEEPETTPEEAPTTLTDEQAHAPAVEQAEDNAPASPLDEQQDETTLKDASTPTLDEEQNQPDAMLEEENTLLIASTPGQQDQPEPASVPARQKSRYGRWVQVLAAVLIVACLVGGGLSYALSRQNNSPKSASGLHATPTAIKPLQISNWCVASGFQPGPQAGQVSLNKVVAISTNDAWLLGSLDKGDMFKNTERSSPLLEHWNGTSWTVVPSADTTAIIQDLKTKVSGDANVTVSLNDIVALSANNIWAVGNIDVSRLSGYFMSQVSAQPIFSHPTKVNSLSSAADRTLIEHWNGHSWQIIEGATIANNALNGLGETLNSITAVSANDIWAVGNQTPALGNDGPLVEHWDGTNWKLVQLPTSLQKESLTSVQARSANDIWAFGYEMHFSLPTGLPVVPPGSPPGTTKIVVETAITRTSTAIHWDGQQWSTERLPDALHNGDVSDAAVISPNDIWVIGTSYTKPQGSHSFLGLATTPTIQHWDGSQWNNVTGPTDLSKGSTFNAISAQGANDIWLMGSTKDNKPLLEHWDGKAWKLVSPTSPASGAVTSMAIAGEKAWALVDPDSGKYSLISLSKLLKGGQSQNAPTTPAMALETNC